MEPIQRVVAARVTSILHYDRDSKAVRWTINQWHTFLGPEWEGGLLQTYRKSAPPEWTEISQVQLGCHE